MFVGVTLLGVALAASVPRWQYQAEQRRAFPDRALTSQLVPGGIAPAALPSSQEARADETSSHAAVELDANEESETLGPESPRERPLLATPDIEPLTVAPSHAFDPHLFGRIEIPRLGLEAIVREGEDEATLSRAVGYLSDTARPGEGGNTALAGHRDTFFRGLKGIEVDDRIRLVTRDETYEYRVDSMRVVQPTEVSVLESSGTEELTLVTCYPFRFVGPAPARFIVKATRIQ
jgi:LPXTG-site transpeptidase (sortase) family protein